MIFMGAGGGGGGKIILVLDVLFLCRLILNIFPHILHALSL